MLWEYNNWIDKPEEKYFNVAGYNKLPIIEFQK